MLLAVGVRPVVAQGQLAASKPHSHDYLRVAALPIPGAGQVNATATEQVCFPVQLQGH